jgi:hypothetical protein
MACDAARTFLEATLEYTSGTLIRMPKSSAFTLFVPRTTLGHLSDYHRTRCRVKDVQTPLEMFSCLSCLSSAENAYPPWAPLGTRKHISGKPSTVIVNARSDINEPWEMVDRRCFTGPAGLSASIGESIYDEHMRVAGRYGIMITMSVLITL